MLRYPNALCRENIIVSVCSYFRCPVQASAALKLSINGVHDQLFKAAIDDIKLTFDAARANMHIGPDTVPDIKECVNLLLPQPFLAQLIETMNRGCSATDTPITAGDLESFINIYLFLCRYRCSPDDFFNEVDYGVESQYGPHPDLVGLQGLFTRCLEGLAFASNAEHRGMQWAESQTFDHSIADAAKGMLNIVSFFMYFSNAHLQHISYHACFTLL